MGRILLLANARQILDGAKREVKEETNLDRVNGKFCDTKK